MKQFEDNYGHIMTSTADTAYYFNSLHMLNDFILKLMTSYQEYVYILLVIPCRNLTWLYHAVAFPGYFQNGDLICCVSKTNMVYQFSCQ